MLPSPRFCNENILAGKNVKTAVGDGAAGARVGLLTMSCVPDDPRVRRQGTALAAAGYSVFAIGLRGGRSRSPDWPVFEIDPGTDAPLTGAARWARRAKWTSASLLSRAAPQTALAASFGLDHRLESMFCTADGRVADVWIANDWKTLPVALRLNAGRPARIIYDTHELATEEYAEHTRWRLFHQPFRHAIETVALSRVDAVTTVSDGISARLHELYRLPTGPRVVRNVPSYQKQMPHATGARIGVLYHGVVAPGRGLEATIESVRLWRPEFGLTIRGPATGEYLASLKHQATGQGVANRVVFAPAVAMVDLVTAASESDIGLFALPGHSVQNAYALPNKFFEYVMAGLALCVSDLPEMSRLVSRYELGHVMSGTGPVAIAAAINAFDVAQIDVAKKNARKAAIELCWEAEQKILLACVAEVLTLQAK